ncbi:MAG: hypothetical protein U1E39_07720 [Planctomycetota bacterium]
MRRLPMVLLALTAVLVPCARVGRAEEPVPEGARLALATERVVVFKDGYALFVKAGTATADARGRVFTEQVPAGAVLGCFWATAAEHRVLALHAGWVETEVARERKESCLSVLDLLRANVGREVTLGSTREGDPGVSGRVVGLLEAPAAEAPRAPDAPSPYPAGTTVRPAAPLVGGSHVVIDAMGRRLVLPVAEVRTVSGAELVTELVRKERVVTRTKRLTVDLGAAAAGRAVTVHLLYFTDGVRWIPTYRVEGTLEKEAELSLTGEVVNDAEDVTDAAIDLVVGVPSFRFKETVSPLTLEAAISGAAAAQVRTYGGRRSDAFAAQRLMTQAMSNSFRNDADDGGGAGATDGAMEVAPELRTDTLQDLFLYSLPKVTLRRGDRAALSLWQSTVPVAHVFTADVEVVRHPREGQASTRSRREHDLGVDATPAGVGASGRTSVWHELELTNTAKVPWTTGAALVTRGPLPVSQNLLGYTSPGVTTRLPLTVAVDVTSKWEERETGREPNAYQLYGNSLTKTLKAGTLTVTNRRREPAEMRLSLSMGGRVETASDGGKVILNEGRRDDWQEWPWWWWGTVANHSDVSWSLTLAPGETKTLSVTFSFPTP